MCVCVRRTACVCYVQCTPYIVRGKTCVRQAFVQNDYIAYLHNLRTLTYTQTHTQTHAYTNAYTHTHTNI